MYFHNQEPRFLKFYYLFMYVVEGGKYGNFYAVEFIYVYVYCGGTRWCSG
jgi:hypothetical protein